MERGRFTPRRWRADYRLRAGVPGCLTLRAQRPEVATLGLERGGVHALRLLMGESIAVASDVAVHEASTAAVTARARSVEGSPASAPRRPAAKLSAPPATALVGTSRPEPQRGNTWGASGAPSPAWRPRAGAHADDRLPPEGSPARSEVPTSRQLVRWRNFGSLLLGRDRKSPRAPPRGGSWPRRAAQVGPSDVSRRRSRTTSVRPRSAGVNDRLCTLSLCLTRADVDTRRVACGLALLLAAAPGGSCRRALWQ